MTAQLPDKFLHEGKIYSIIGINGNGLPTPADYGLIPGMWHTACWRGYISTYSYKNNELTLKDWQIGSLAHPEQKWPQINEIKARPRLKSLKERITYWRKRQKSNWYAGFMYHNLNIETGFTGGILIGDGFIPELYVHMGFAKPYQYEQVHEFIFHEGTLVSHTDHSKKAQQWREEVIKQREIARQKHENHANNNSSEKISPEEAEQAFIEAVQSHIEWRFSMDYEMWF